MEMLLLLLVATTLETSTQGYIVENIYPLGFGSQTKPVATFDTVNCLSWRLAVEANNIIGWEKVPWGCSGYLREYLKGDQYSNDAKVVIDEAIYFVEHTPLPKDLQNAWIFDIDDTLLSNVPYFDKHGFGSKPLNDSLFIEWLLSANAKAVPECQRLYNTVLSLGIKVILLSGRPEDLRDATITNLNEAGYHSWHKLILRSDEYMNMTQLEYKSIIRAKLGLRFIGNIGGQWSDLLGPHVGRRKFKLPNPMYYVA